MSLSMVSIMGPLEFGPIHGKINCFKRFLKDQRGVFLSLSVQETSVIRQNQQGEQERLKLHVSIFRFVLSSHD